MRHFLPSSPILFPNPLKSKYFFPVTQAVSPAVIFCFSCLGHTFMDAHPPPPTPITPQPRVLSSYLEPSLCGPVQLILCTVVCPKTKVWLMSRCRQNSGIFSTANKMKSKYRNKTKRAF